MSNKTAASQDSAANAAEPRPRWTYPDRIFEPDFHAPDFALKPLDRVEPKQLVWEGPGGYAPRGSVTIVAGEHGSGKTFLAVDWAARISKGYPAFGRSAGRRAELAARTANGAAASGDSGAGNLEGPWLHDGRPIDIYPSEAVVAHAGDLSVEELRRRIDAAGGLPERIAALSLSRPGQDQKFTFSAIYGRVVALASAVRGAGDVRLLVIDHLEALAGNLHETPSAALLGFLLANLAELAALANVAIVVLAHLPRGGGQAAARKLEAYCNAAPVVYLAACDPERPSRKLLVTVKNTLGPPAPARAFEIADGKVAIGEELPELSADEFMAPVSRRLEARHERESAARWLLAALADGPVASRDLFRQARECGIAAKTLRRAAESLGLSPRKSSFDGPWQWQLDEASSERGAESAEQPPAGAAMQAPIEAGQVRAAEMAPIRNGEPEASASVLHRAAQRLDRRVTPTPETEADASGSPKASGSRMDGAGSPVAACENGQPRDEALAAPLAANAGKTRPILCGV